MNFPISVEAYCKIILHSAKYSTLSVCGILIGAVDASKSQVSSVTDSIPVCHNAPVGPIFDMAADLVIFLHVLISVVYSILL